NVTLPALRNFNARFTFRDNALTLDRFGGDVAGGPFRMNGRVSFPKLTEPTLDLQLNADSVLVARNDTLTARPDADLKTIGPLQGVVQLQKVEATLPFSRLEVSRGFLTFTPEDSMNPRIDLQGTSVIRDYTVRVYVYGTLLSPDAIFTSEPPLAQEEIISLIAT